MMGKGKKYELNGSLIGMLVIALFSLFASCCTQVRYVPVETLRIDSVLLKSTRVDSVFVHDSTSVTQRGDTVTEYRYRYIYKYKDRVDTLYINRTDSVRIPYPVEIEKKLTVWQRMKIEVGGWSMATVIVIILIVVGRMIYKLKK